MPEIAEAQALLAALGMPAAQHNEMAALTLLALCGLKPNDPWSAAQRHSLTISKGVMTFVRDHYARQYAPNTRETVRRQVLHQFVQANIAEYNPDEPALPTNSPKAHYSLSEAALAVIRAYGRADWTMRVAEFAAVAHDLSVESASARQAAGVLVRLPDGTSRQLSPGEHNHLQAQVIAQFVPHFASGALLLYLGDTADKDLYIAVDRLAALGITITEHDKLPDLIFYLPDKHWLYLIEAVTSHGPMTPKRIIELTTMLNECSAGKIFVTAFSTFTEFRKHIREIAWETEIWIAEAPEHLIHFNGDRFLGPRST